MQKKEMREVTVTYCDHCGKDISRDNTRYGYGNNIYGECCYSVWEKLTNDYEKLRIKSVAISRIKFMKFF